MNARDFTLKILLKFYKSGAYSNLLLDSELDKINLSEKDKSFASALFYGVIEKQITLDYELSLYLKQPLKRLRPEVLQALRMGAYQLLFMQKIPASAAINESVNLVKKNHCGFAGGLVNAVLRKLAQNGLKFPEKTDKSYWSVRYAVPQALIDLWIEDYGEVTTGALLEAFETSASTYIRVNILKTDTASLAQQLCGEGVQVQEVLEEHNAIAVAFNGSITHLPSFQQGLFHVEDIAAQTAAELLEVHPGERVLDCCSAPGGKAFTLAEQMGYGEVVACDIYDARVRLIRNGAQRLGIDNIIIPKVADATVFHEALGFFDKVLCDVPCSGLGTIGKKPEIKYKSIAEINALCDTQYQILKTAFQYLKSGGRLVYSTCTLHKAENEDMIERFLENEPECEKCFVKTFFPHTDKTDGFFAAVLKKK